MRAGDLDNHVVCDVIQTGWQGNGTDSIRRASSDSASMKEAIGHSPFVKRTQQDISTRGIYLVGLPRMDRVLLHHLNLQSIQLEIKDLTEVHNNTLVDLLQ